jgi:cold shock protein
MSQGVVRWFSPKTGYGFITSDEFPDVDIMVHFNDVIMDGYKKLIKDQKVDFEVINTDKGLKAENVKIIKTNKGE